MERKPERETERRRNGKRDEHAEDANRSPALETAPLHGVRATLGERRADQPTDKRMTGARGKPAPPGQPVPDRRGEHARADHSHAACRRHSDDSRDRLRDRRPHQERPKHVEHRRQQDGLARPCATRRYERRDRVRSVVEAVRQSERQRERESKPEVDAQSSPGRTGVSGRSGDRATRAPLRFPVAFSSVSGKNFERRVDFAASRSTYR